MSLHHQRQYHHPIWSISTTTTTTHSAVAGDGEERVMVGTSTGQVLMNEHVLSPSHPLAVIGTHILPNNNSSSSSSSTLAISCGMDASLSLWDMASRSLIRQRHLDQQQQPMVTCTCLSRPKKGDGVVYVGGMGRVSRVSWDLKRVEYDVVAVLHHGSGGVTAMACHDDEYLSVGLDSGQVFLFQINTSTSGGGGGGGGSTMRLMATWSGHDQQVRALAMTDRLLASGSDDRRIMVVDYRQNNSLMQLKEHGAWVTSLVFMDGNVLVSADMEGVMKVWRVDHERECVHTLTHHHHHHAVWQLRVQNGMVYACSEDGCISAHRLP